MNIPIGTVESNKRQIALVIQTLCGDRYSRGPLTDEFESLLAKYHSVKEAVFMASGTCALECLLEAAKEKFGWPDGAEVIVPATTFIATVAAVRRAGMVPVLCDVEYETANIDPRKIGRCITPKTVALLPVHLLGRAANMTYISGIAEDFRLKIIEDCCEAFGVSHGELPVGTFGVGGALSTYVCHHVSTGVGGAVLTNDPEIATICRSLMQHGRDPAYLKLEDDDCLVGEAQRDMLARRYSFVRWGHSYRSTELEAALGVGELEESVFVTAKQCGRRIVAYEIGKRTAKYPDRILPQKWGENSYPLFYPFVCNSPETCAGLAAEFEKWHVETRPLMPLLNQKIIVDMLSAQAKTPADYPNALRLSKNAFIIGCYSPMPPEKIDLIGQILEGYFGSTERTPAQDDAQCPIPQINF